MYIAPIGGNKSSVAKLMFVNCKLQGSVDDSAVKGNMHVYWLLLAVKYLFVNIGFVCEMFESEVLCTSLFPQSCR